MDYESGGAATSSLQVVVCRTLSYARRANGNVINLDLDIIMKEMVKALMMSESVLLIASGDHV